MGNKNVCTYSGSFWRNVVAESSGNKNYWGRKETKERENNKRKIKTRMKGIDKRNVYKEMTTKELVPQGKKRQHLKRRHNLLLNI